MIYRAGPPAMLSLGGFSPPPPQAPCYAIPQNTISQSLPFPNNINQTHLSFCSNRVTQLSFSAGFRQFRTGLLLCVFALKNSRKDGNSFLEMDGIDDDYEEEENSDDEDVVVPLGNMKKWLKNRPRGFGEGKEYDTSIEDKLVEEMEQSRLAQLANINNLKNNSEETSSKKEHLRKQKVSEAVPSGLRVRLVNLPKKKNVHRDLRQAFKDVPGIVKIIPAVSGNQKTREPICKGLAFVDFKSEDEANRFVRIFSRQSITFGKIQKQIKCERVISSSPNPAYEQSDDRTDHVPQLEVLSLEGDLDADFDMNNASLVSRDETVSDDYEEADDEHVSATWEDEEECMDTSRLLDPSGDDIRELITESVTDSLSSKQKDKGQANRKKLMPKRKGGKVPKLNIPGSANRLKMKEKALLTGVFSKYGAKTASAVKEQS